jgi:hypothetical protein
MAILWMDGFNHYRDFKGDLSPYISQGEQYGYDDVTGLYEEVHDYTTVIYDGEDNRTYVMGDKNYDHMDFSLNNEQTVIVGWHAYLGAGWTAYPMLRFRDSVNGATQITLDGSLGRRLQVWRGDGDSGTLLGTSTAGLSLPWHWVFIEVKVHIDNSPNGYVEVRVDGETVIDVSGVDTANTVALYTDQLYWGYMERMSVNNLYVTDGEVDTPKTDADGFLGPIQIVTLMPNGDNSPNQWTRSAGTENWENVDEKKSTNPDTTYNYTGTTGNVDSYTFSDLSTAGGTWTVLAVDSIIRAQRADAVSAESITVTTGSQTPVSNNVTEVEGAGNYWNYFHNIYEYSSGTTDWTETTVNALTVDVEYD